MNSCSSLIAGDGGSSLSNGSDGGSDGGSDCGSDGGSGDSDAYIAGSDGENSLFSSLTARRDSSSDVMDNVGSSGFFKRTEGKI